jgi:hypothetical protein
LGGGGGEIEPQGSVTVRLSHVKLLNEMGADGSYAVAICQVPSVSLAAPMGSVPR